MLATISSGHADAADWLFLIAFILFALAAIVHFVGESVPKLPLIEAGLASLAMAWFVL